jgi:hypothetical protein
MFLFSIIIRDLNATPEIAQIYVSVLVAGYPLFRMLSEGAVLYFSLYTNPHPQVQSGCL